MKEYQFAGVPEDGSAQPEENAQQPLGYYYDDGTGYEIFNPDEDKDDPEALDELEDESAAIEDESAAIEGERFERARGSDLQGQVDYLRWPSRRMSESLYISRLRCSP